MGTGDRREHPLDAFTWGRCLSRRSRRTLGERIEWADLPPGALVMAKNASPRWVTFVVDGELEVVEGHSPHRVLGAGDAAGIVEALHNTPFCTTAVTGASGATVGFLERRAFVGALQTIPDFAAAILRAVTDPPRPQAAVTHTHRLRLRWAA